MIDNEKRYKEKILTRKEEAALNNNLNVSLYTFVIGFILLMLCFIPIILLIVYSFINTMVAAISLILVLVLLVSSILLLYISERDVMSSKDLNERLFIYFDFLEDSIKTNKKKMFIWAVNRRISRNLFQLESNVKNVFLFNSSEFDIDLILNIRKFLTEDLSFLLKNGGKQLILEVIDKIKKTHLSSESLNLSDSKNEDNTTEHEEKIISIKKLLRKCDEMKLDDGERQEHYIKIYKFVISPPFLISLVIIIALGMIRFINGTDDSSTIISNIGIISLSLSIISFILQISKRK